MLHAGTRLWGIHRCVHRLLHDLTVNAFRRMKPMHIRRVCRCGLTMSRLEVLGTPQGTALLVLTALLFDVIQYSGPILAGHQAMDSVLGSGVG